LVVLVSDIGRAEERVNDKPQPSRESSANILGPEEIERQRKADEAAKEFTVAQKEASRDTAKASKTTSTRSLPRVVSPGDGTPRGYEGFVGDAAVNVTMIFFKDHKVSGDFYFLRTPETRYTFSGHNPKDGFVKFDIFSGGVPFAKAQLKKDPRVRESILWDGTLTPRDEPSLRFYLNRPAEKSADGTVWPTTVEEFDQLKGFDRYEGVVTDGRVRSTAVFKLKIQTPKCEGFYYQVYPNGRTSFIFRLAGTNPKGLLILREFDDEGMSAELYLEKKLSGNAVSWQGKMTNHRFSQVVKTVLLVIYPSWVLGVGFY
jgi:hypothetical protein